MALFPSHTTAPLWGSDANSLNCHPMLEWSHCSGSFHQAATKSLLRSGLQRKILVLKVGEDAEVKFKDNLDVPKVDRQAVALDPEKVQKGHRAQGGSRGLLPPNTFKSTGLWSTRWLTRYPLRVERSSPGSGSGSGSVKYCWFLDDEEAVDDLVLDLDLGLLQTPPGDSAVAPHNSHSNAKNAKQVT